MQTFENDRIRVTVSDELAKQYDAEYIAHLQGKQTPEQILRGLVLSDAMSILGNSSEAALLESEPITGQQIEDRAIELLTIQHLIEHCRYNVGETLMRMNGGHRMSLGMAADVDAANSWARNELRTNRTESMDLGKKSIMDELKIKFIEGCAKNGYDENIVNKIWADWEAFAQYAFNKSHSTCYALVAYQTGYLKAHYPAEFMAAVLSRNISDIKKITVFMDETRRMGMEVLGPDVNESNVKFTVNKDGNIRFGLGAIKGVGEGAVLQLIEEREKNGLYKSIYDLVERVNLNSLNKKNLEAMAVAGAFDCFQEISRAQYFALDTKGSSFIESLIRYGNNAKTIRNSSIQTLFGDSGGGFELIRPEPTVCPDWPKLEKLNREKEVIGIYLSSHPLDDFKLELDTFTTATLADLQNMREYLDREVDASLSGGELKRVEIATLMARRLGLAIFDEPEAGIDLWSFKMLVETFRQMTRDRHDSVIIISHQERIMQLADEIIVIADGRVRSSGSREDLLPQLLGEFDDVCNLKGNTMKYR